MVDDAKAEPETLTLTYSIRRRRILALVTQYSTAAEFAAVAGVPATSVPRWKAGKIIGEKLARAVEESLGLPRGYLDFDHDEAGNRVPDAPQVGQDVWPFHFPKAKFDRLDENKRGLIEGIVVDAVKRFLKESGESTKKKSSHPSKRATTRGAPTRRAS